MEDSAGNNQPQPPGLTGTQQAHWVGSWSGSGAGFGLGRRGAALEGSAVEGVALTEVERLGYKGALLTESIQHALLAPQPGVLIPPIAQARNALHAFLKAAPASSSIDALTALLLRGLPSALEPDPAAQGRKNAGRTDAHGIAADGKRRKEKDSRSDRHDKFVKGSRVSPKMARKVNVGAAKESRQVEKKMDAGKLSGQTLVCVGLLCLLYHATVDLLSSTNAPASSTTTSATLDSKSGVGLNFRLHGATHHLRSMLLSLRPCLNLGLQRLIDRRRSPLLDEQTLLVSLLFDLYTSTLEKRPESFVAAAFSEASLTRLFALATATTPLTSEALRLLERFSAVPAFLDPFLQKFVTGCFQRSLTDKGIVTRLQSSAFFQSTNPALIKSTSQTLLHMLLSSTQSYSQCRTASSTTTPPSTTAFADDPGNFVHNLILHLVEIADTSNIPLAWTGSEEAVRCLITTLSDEDEIADSATPYPLVEKLTVALSLGEFVKDTIFERLLAWMEVSQVFEVSNALMGAGGSDAADPGAQGKSLDRLVTHLAPLISELKLSGQKGARMHRLWLQCRAKAAGYGCLEALNGVSAKEMDGLHACDLLDISATVLSGLQRLHFTDFSLASTSTSPSTSTYAPPSEPMTSEECVELFDLRALWRCCQFLVNRSLKEAENLYKKDTDTHIQNLIAKWLRALFASCGTALVFKRLLDRVFDPASVPIGPHCFLQSDMWVVEAVKEEPLIQSLDLSTLIEDIFPAIRKLRAKLKLTPDVEWLVACEESLFETLVPFFNRPLAVADDFSPLVSCAKNLLNAPLTQAQLLVVGRALCKLLKSFSPRLATTTPEMKAVFDELHRPILLWAQNAYDQSWRAASTLAGSIASESGMGSGSDMESAVVSVSSAKEIVAMSRNVLMTVAGSVEGEMAIPIVAELMRKIHEPECALPQVIAMLEISAVAIDTIVHSQKPLPTIQTSLTPLLEMCGAQISSLHKSESQASSEQGKVSRVKRRERRDKLIQAWYRLTVSLLEAQTKEPLTIDRSVFAAVMKLAVETQAETPQSIQKTRLQFLLALIAVAQHWCRLTSQLPLETLSTAVQNPETLREPLRQPLREPSGGGSDRLEREEREKVVLRVLNLHLRLLLPEAAMGCTALNSTARRRAYRLVVKCVRSVLANSQSDIRALIHAGEKASEGSLQQAHQHFLEQQVVKTLLCGLSMTDRPTFQRSFVVACENILEANDLLLSMDARRALEVAVEAAKPLCFNLDKRSSNSSRYGARSVSTRRSTRSRISIKSSYRPRL